MSPNRPGVGYADKGMGVAAGDYDNDGYIDLYVTNYGHNILYHNNGNGTFTDVTASAGVASSGWSTSAAFIDYDRDGLLDIAVVHYVDFYRRPCYMFDGKLDYCGPSPFKGTATELYRNLGNGRFKNVTDEVGLNAKLGPGLGILTGDFGSDGFPGFMVANDGAANHLWINERRGTAIEASERVFKEAGLTHGLAYASDGKPRAGMGIASGDIYRRRRRIHHRDQSSHRGVHAVSTTAEWGFCRCHGAIGAVAYFAALHRIWCRPLRYGK